MSDLFGRQFKKKRTRVKEKLLEGLGKAKATQDDVFDQHAANLAKQTKACERLYRDLKAYGVSMKAMVAAQKTLRETIRDLYEPDWPEREHLCALTQSLDLQWDEFEKKINEQLMGSVSAYMAQLPPLKEKVAKRGRKLVDYDGARNTYNALKASSKKGEDDPKVVKAASDYDLAKALYADINNELLDALPAFYDSRITFIVDTLQTLFNADSSNHLECAKYNKMLVTHLDSLGNSFDSLRVPRPESTSSSQLDDKSCSPTSTPQLTPLPEDKSATYDTVTTSQKENDVVEENLENRVYPVLNAEDLKSASDEISPKVNPNESKVSLNPFDEDDETEEKKDSTNPFEESDDDGDNLGDGEEEEKKEMPVAKARNVEKTQDKETVGDCRNRKVLYKVRAAHHYSAQSSDELTFDVGDIINVLESREEDEQDDGWLLGVKESNGAHGMFPANFTKQI
uniref:SH3 domain-containing protein n=1 Tax=Syphacia muris TaxID=451379 RepID=A0A0N5A9A8_9BILA